MKHLRNELVWCAAMLVFLSTQAMAAPTKNAKKSAMKPAAIKRTAASAEMKNSEAKALAQPETPRDLYERLRRSYRADESITPAQLRADRASYAGKALEWRGVIGGILKNGRARTMLLNTQNERLSLPLPDALIGIENARSGQAVRVLVLVKTGEEKEDLFSLLAMDEDITPRALEKSSNATAPREAAQRTAEEEHAEVISILRLDDREVPPMVSMKNPGRPLSSSPTIPDPPAAQPSQIPAKTPGLDAADNSDSDQFYYFKRMAKRFNKKLTEAQANEIATAIPAAAAENKMDPRFIAAIIAVESDFDIYCLSGSGAMGLGQLMPFNVPEARIKNAWNPTENIFGTARLLRGHLDDFAGRRDAGGNDVSTLLAVAAYNAGPNAVKRAGYKVPNGSQVQRYVWKVYNRYKEFAPEKFN